MKIAIVGAGLSGLAVTCLLSQVVPLGSQIVLLDEKGVGGGASGAGAGMMHPFAGARSRLNWRGFEGMRATLSYLERYPEVILQRGIFRPAQSAAQRADFSVCAEQFPEEASLREGGLWLPKGVVVDLPLYLSRLLQRSLEAGVVFVRKKMETREELKDFTVVILAVGGDFSPFRSVFPEGIRLKAVKGQLLELSWPSDQEPLAHALNGAAYLVQAGERALLGATYEKEWQEEAPDIAKAGEWLLPRGKALFPGIEQMPILGCRAGLRGVTPNHHPFIARADHPQETWLIGGMGSKGLLYHMLFGKELVQRMGFPIF